MKQPYQIEFDPIPPSEETIRQYKDFDRLLEQFENQQSPKSPLVRRLLWSSLAVAASLVGIIILWNNSFVKADRNYAQESQQFFEAQPYNVSPIPQSPTAKLVSQTVDITTQKLVRLDDKLLLDFHGVSLQNTAGEAVTGEVKLVYRTLLDPVDYFMAGVNMTFDTLQFKYLTTASGMVEVYAEQNGERLQLAPNANLEVRFELTGNATSLEGYHLYRFDEQANNWQYAQSARFDPIKMDVTAIQAKIQEIEQARETAIDKIEDEFQVPQPPVSPKKYDPTLPVFDYSFLKSFVKAGEQELLKDYEGALFQSQSVTTNTPTDWVDANIRKLDNDQFEITFFNATDSLKIIAEAVYANISATTQAKYESELEKYETALASLEARKAEAIAAINKQFDEQQAELSSLLESDATERRELTFEVDAFGLWSCQKAMPTPEAKAMVRFTDENGQVYENQKGYLLDRTANTLRQVLVTEKTILRFYPEHDNQFWIIRADNSVAQLRPADFEQIAINRKLQVIPLQTSEEAVNSEERVRKVLEL